MAYQTHVLTDESVVVILKEDGKSRSVPIPVENPMYAKVRDALKNHLFDGLVELVDLAANIRKHASGRFMVSNGSVFIDKDMLPDVLSARLIDFVEHDPPLDTKPLERFWDNLKANPNLRSREMLYAFLEHNGIPVTADGCFIAYKRVTNDYKDCRTQTFDNSVGAVVQMDRDKVDSNPQVTCSTGLHVAAFPYAKDFYGSGRLMEVKVSPFDVVAVPNDYNGQKMRVCKYEVMRECEDSRPDSEVLYDYDDTADVDEWDDSDFEDDVIDDIVDVKFVDADSPDDLVPVAVTLDGRGRACVPANFVKALGLSENDTVNAYIDRASKLVNLSTRKDLSFDDVRVYVVDKDNNVRISAYVLGLAGLGLCNEVDMEIDEEGDIVIG